MLSKEEDFILPEKWYIVINKDNIDFCKSLKNRELNFNEGYDYVLGGYYHTTGGISPNGRTEISFENFKKYVLKIDLEEKSVKKEDLSYLIEFLNKKGIKR